MLYGITDRRSFSFLSPEEYLELAFRTRASLLQLREKDLREGELGRLLRHGVRLARRTGKLLLVNSATSLALAEQADGVHLTSRQSVSKAVQRRRESGRKDFLVGKSVHSVAEAVRAESEGVDYVLLSPIFPPISKQSHLPELGWSGLREAAQMLYIPVIALGGVDESTEPEIFSTSALGAAGISWLKREIEQLLRQSNSRAN